MCRRDAILSMHLLWVQRGALSPRALRGTARVTDSVALLPSLVGPRRVGFVNRDVSTLFRVWRDVRPLRHLHTNLKGEGNTPLCHGLWGEICSSFPLSTVGSQASRLRRCGSSVSGWHSFVPTDNRMRTPGLMTTWHQCGSNQSLECKVLLSGWNRARWGFWAGPAGPPRRDLSVRSHMVEERSHDEQKFSGLVGRGGPSQLLRQG